VKTASPPREEAVEPHGWGCRPGKRGAQDQGSRNALCASPRIPPLGSRTIGSPGDKPTSKIANFQISSNLSFSPRLTALLRHNPVTSPSRHSSQLQCSTKQHQQCPQTFVVLELTSNFLILCSTYPNKPRRAWHTFPIQIPIQLYEL